MDALYTKLLKINHLMSLSLAEIAKEEDLNPSELMIVLDVKNNPPSMPKRVWAPVR